MRIRDSFRLPPLGVTLLCMAVPLFRLYCLGGGAPDPETAVFLEHYLAGRGMFETVFDPLRNDWGFYQARELSYFFDRLDALWIGWCAKQGFLHFTSLFTLLFTAGTVFLQQYGIRRLFPKIPAWQTALLSLLFVLLPQSGNAVFFRSAKPGAAFCLTLAAFLLIALLRTADRKQERLLAFILFATLLAASLFDRQGAFFTAAAAAGAGTMLFTGERLFHAPEAILRKTALAAAAALAAAGAAAACNLALFPALIRACNGYWPAAEFQRIPGLLSLQTAAGGAEFLFGNLGDILTGTRGIGAAAAAVALSLAAFLAAFRRKETRTAAAAFALFLAAAWICSAGMYARHPVILHPGIMYGSYFLPFLALLVPFAALGLEAIPRRAGGAVLALLAILQLTMLGLRPPEPPPGAREALYFLDGRRKGLPAEPGQPVPLSLRRLADRLRPDQPKAGDANNSAIPASSSGSAKGSIRHDSR